MTLNEATVDAGQHDRSDGPESRFLLETCGFKRARLTTRRRFRRFTDRWRRLTARFSARKHSAPGCKQTHKEAMAVIKSKLGVALIVLGVLAVVFGTVVVFVGPVIIDEQVVKVSWVHAGVLLQIPALKCISSTKVQVVHKEKKVFETVTV